MSQVLDASKNSNLLIKKRKSIQEGLLHLLE